MELWSRKLRRSGYPATVRHEMIGASMRRYERMCEEEDRGVRPVHRARDWKEEERQRAKELKKTNWHRSKEDQISAPLILDPTSGSIPQPSHTLLYHDGHLHLPAMGRGVGYHHLRGARLLKMSVLNAPILHFQLQIQNRQPSIRAC